MRATTSITIRSHRRRAFTLVELLTIIVIIGILASLTVSVAGIASRRSKVSRTQAELARLDLAIREYKARYGFDYLVGSVHHVDGFQLDGPQSSKKQKGLQNNGVPG